jgi:hypothetical protein
MKLTIKTLALAVALAASATGASAAIDNGYDSGNGELFVNVWDANGSYTRDLNISIDAFQAALAGTGSFSSVFAADTTFTSFLTGAVGGTRTTAGLRFDILATDSNGDNRILATYNTVALPTKVMTDDSTSAAASKTMLFANAVNNASNGAESIAVTKTSPAYANKSGVNVGTLGSLSFNNYGTLAANNSFATGLNFLRIDGASSGAETSLYTQYTDGSALKVWFGADNALHIEAAVLAVPEPESYAMLLAGLGLLGFMARRNKRA